MPHNNKNKKKQSFKNIFFILSPFSFFFFTFSFFCLNNISQQNILKQSEFFFF